MSVAMSQSLGNWRNLVEKSLSAEDVERAIALADIRFAEGNGHQCRHLFILRRKDNLLSLLAFDVTLLRIDP